MLTKESLMNGIISFVCWISWISRCFPAAILAIFFWIRSRSTTESRASRPRELRKARLKKDRQWRNRDQWIWCQGTSWVRRKILRKIWFGLTAQWIKNWTRLVFHPATGNWRETSTKTQQCILKRGNKMKLNLAERWIFKLGPRQETGARWG